MNESTKIPCVRGERCLRPLLTSTSTEQGSDKSVEKGYGETWVTTGVNHDERGARSHSAVITPEQGWLAVHNTTHVTPMDGVSASNTALQCTNRICMNARPICPSTVANI